MPASSPLRNSAPRPGATRSGGSAPPSSGPPGPGLRGGVNSPEAPSASSIARRAEPPSTLKCGCYPNGIGNFPCENKVYLNGVDFQAFRQDDDAPVHLQVTTGAGDWVYLAQALDAVERGVLSLGFAQREETSMNEGDEVTVRRWFPSPASSLTTLRLCVAPCGWADGRAEGRWDCGRAHVDAAHLTRFVKEKFSGQVFKEGQTFVVLRDPAYDPYGVGDSCIPPCTDTRIALDVTVERSCTVDGKPAQCVEFAGQRPWPKFGQLVEGTRLGQREVWQRAGTGRSLNLRRNNHKWRLPLIVQDVIDVVVAVALVTSLMGIMMLWFFVSTFSGPSGPSQDLFDTLATRIESTLLISTTTTKIIISWTELGRAMAFVVRLARWAALKFALCNVLAYGGYRVLGYVLPVLRFFSQIPW